MEIIPFYTRGKKFRIIQKYQFGRFFVSPCARVRKLALAKKSGYKMPKSLAGQGIMAFF
jgi:hypothetical protein